jgi:hypothetical protein
MMRRAAIALLALVAACADVRPPACGEGERSVISDTLYFGTAYPGGEVSAAEWSGFVADVVTPRFPDGFTAWSATGQWRGADGRIVREPSHVLSVIHEAGAPGDRAMGEIVAAYKSRFHQESVLRVRAPACAVF